MLTFFQIPGSDKTLFTTPSGFAKFTTATQVEPDCALPVDVTGREPIGNRVGIVNAFSVAMGDQLNALSAFRVWQKLHPDCSVTFYQFDKAKMSCLNPPDVSVFGLPNLLSHLCGHTCYYDFSSFIEHDLFQRLPMVDFFLNQLGVDYGAVEPSQKRIRYSPRGSVDIFRVLRGMKRQILLFHHEASSKLRTMPDKEARRLITEIVRCSDYLVISACGLESPQQFCGLGDRFVDVSRWSLTFDDLACMVQQVDCVVSVDSVPIHLADAYSKPCVGLFPTINPDLRVRYYPNCSGISLGTSGKHKMIGVSDEELQTIRATWPQVSGSQIVSLLEQ